MNRGVFLNNESIMTYFESYLTNERHYSKLTSQAYLSDCRQFIRFLAQTGEPSLLKASLDDARMYMSQLINKKYKNRSIARKMSSLRSLYHFLLRNEEIDYNPFSHLNMKKVSFRKPSFFFLEEMDQLFQAVDGDEPLDLRNQALLELLYASGLSVSECVNLLLEDLDFDLSILRVSGRRKKERYVPFGEFAYDALTKYIKNGRSLLMNHHKKEHSYLFINHHGEPLTVSGVQYILREIIKKTSLKGKIHPHKIRHSFAVHLLNNGADIRTVQEFLGHASLSSTQVYTDVTKENLQEQYKKYFSRS